VFLYGDQFFDGKFRGKKTHQPLVNQHIGYHIAIEHGPVEIVDLPIQNGDFP
jgi:hypothetical protein